VIDEVVKSYAKNKFAIGYEKRFNPHNEFVQIAVALGLVGFSLFVAMFVLGIQSAVRYKNYLYLSFHLLFMLSCQTESMLSRQKGVVFFAFFSGMLCFSYQASSAKTKPSELLPK
jgi:O-antigen ligase